VTDAFGEQRPRLFALAYRMLGSAASAEDVVQEAWIRWQKASGVDAPAAWLSTVVTNLCLDELKSARARREAYVGPWLPEPIATSPEEVDPESVSMAFLRVLERLSPVERAVYLLHAVFDSTHGEIASILGKDEATVRQVFHRAKARVVAERPRFAPSKEAHARLLSSFVEACARGDLAGLRALLAEDATAWTDGGGKVRAALKPLYGSDAVARFFVGIVRKGADEGLSVQLAEMNGWPTVVARRAGAIAIVLSIETDGALIFGVHVVSNPEKLLHVV
jgi:RNA polymerase sigma-70 factor, ECF subfamily